MAPSPLLEYFSTFLSSYQNPPSPPQAGPPTSQRDSARLCLHARACKKAHLALCCWPGGAPGRWSVIPPGGSRSPRTMELAAARGAPSSILESVLLLTHFVLTASLWQQITIIRGANRCTETQASKWQSQKLNTESQAPVCVPNRPHQTAPRAACMSDNAVRT